MIRREDYTDFHAVDSRHAAIHARLENWASWCRNRTGSNVSPMFRLYRADEHWEGNNSSVSVDSIDASKIAKAVVALPLQNRLAINWCYVVSSNPKKACKSLGVSMSGLFRSIVDGRQMLVNRGV